MKKVLSKIWTVIKNILTGIIIVITFSLLVMKLMGDTPSLFGYNLYYIATESMEPSLEVGDIILSKEVKDVSKLETGDVITYLGDEGSFNGKLITHEIIKVNEHEDGSYTFITKGTHPDATEDPEIDANQIKTVMVFEVPLLGKLMQLINHPIGFLILIVTPLGICLFGEIKNLVKVCNSKEEESEEIENEENN